MLQITKCPSCAAPLEFEGSLTEKCKFCGSRITVLQNNIHSDSTKLLDDKKKLDDILQIVRSGSKIQAIKVFRETFGGGLKEAKDAVESLERGETVDLQVYKSQNGINAAGNTGCAMIFAVSIGFIVIAASIAIYAATN